MVAILDFIKSQWGKDEPNISGGLPKRARNLEFFQ
jgi:hypothetical protein